MGKGGCTAAGRAARSKTQGQSDLSEGCVRRDDAYKVPAAHFMWGLLQTNSRKSRCRAYGLNKQLFAQTAPPPLRGRGRGCGAERRRWRMQRGGAPAAVEKIEQASSAKIFSGTARRRGQIRRGYLWSASVRSTDLFFPIIEGKTIFVSSTAKRQRGLARGNSFPLTRFCLLLAVQKEAPAG